MSCEEVQALFQEVRVLLEYLGTMDFDLLKQGEAPTFLTETQQKLIDFTLCSRELVTEVCEWSV
jgi:hypothetical protein